MKQLWGKWGGQWRRHPNQKVGRGHHQTSACHCPWYTISRKDGSSTVSPNMSCLCRTGSCAFPYIEDLISPLRMLFWSLDGVASLRKFHCASRKDGSSTVSSTCHVGFEQFLVSLPYHEVYISPSWMLGWGWDREASSLRCSCSEDIIVALPGRLWAYIRIRYSGLSVHMLVPTHRFRKGARTPACVSICAKSNNLVRLCFQPQPSVR